MARSTPPHRCSAQTARRANLPHSVGQLPPCIVGQITSILPAVSCSARRGVSRSSRTVERGMRWPPGVAVRVSRADERTEADGQAVWSRHPDAGVLVGDIPMTGASKPGPLGEHGAAVQPIAQGRPDVSANPVVTAACFSFCRRAMGAARTRPSLRPSSGRAPRPAKLGRKNAPRGCGAALTGQRFRVERREWRSLGETAIDQAPR
ncbi:hypothetical protein ACVIJ6_003506 [Bradyrhizobium sp. USDA 4369]